MSAGFTPGPWFAKSAFGFPGFWVMRNECGQGWIRGLRVDANHAGAFTEADANLIAAAPDLYTQLVRAADLLDRVSGQDFQNCVRVSREVLARIDGIASEVSSVGGLK